MKLGSLCTGYGGLDLAVDALLGTETVWLSEIDTNAAKVCEARFPGVPNLGDLTVIDWSQVEPVDVLTAGYPCQPFSHAGKRQGTNDARHIWPYILDALRVLRPRLAVFENVAGHLSLGFDAVLGDLASVGFDAEWCVVRASDVGACHRRQRLFIIVTDSDSAGSQARLRRPRSGDAGRLQPVERGATATAHPDSSRPQGRGRDDLASGEVEAAAHGGGAAPDPDSPRVEGAGRAGSAGRVESVRDVSDWGAFAGAINRHADLIGRPAPAPTDDKGRLSPHLVEWMMCLPEGWVTDLLPRNPALKALGNGVVPPQAAYAVAHLLARHEAQEVAA